MGKSIATSRSLFLLALCGLGISGMLIQGCEKKVEDTSTASPSAATAPKMDTTATAPAKKMQAATDDEKPAGVTSDMTAGVGAKAK